MKGFLASDVLFERARGQINETLTQGRGRLQPRFPTSAVPARPIDRWLDNIQVVTTLNAFASGRLAASTAWRC